MPELLPALRLPEVRYTSLKNALSVLGGLYRPLAAAYQAVTLKTDVRDLGVGAAALLQSLGLVAVAQALPRFGAEVLATALAGGYAGLVVTEYAAWARANPDRGLERAWRSGGGRGMTPPGTRSRPAGRCSGPPYSASASGCFSPSPRTCGRRPRSSSGSSGGLAGHDPERAGDVVGMWLLAGLVGMVVGFVLVGSHLSGLRPANPLLALRVAGRAVVVFLTYPDPRHPLSHRLRLPWLRPVSVRVALTGLVLLTAATAILAPAERPKPAEPPAPWPEPPAYAPAPFPPPPGYRPIPQGDLDLARVSGQSPEVWFGAEFRSRPAVPPPPPPASAGETKVETAEANRPGPLAVAVALVVGPPVLLFQMVWLVGLTVLPTYNRHFETP